MYIAPNSTIHILRNVPLDNTYKNTIHFNGTAEQASYFTGLSKYTVSNYTYQRKERILRVGLLADNLYDCNYIMFKNTAYGDKWFYAFIKDVEYVNDNASNITFEIDVMQTWYFNYRVLESFVEREHSVTDNPGDNIVTEPIEMGDIICEAMTGTNYFDSYVAVIATAYDPDETPGGVYGGLFSGVKYIGALLDSASQIDDLLEFIKAATEANAVDSIVSIFIMPTRFFTTKATPVVEVVKVYKNTELSGYTPKNKKLLTYPFNFLGVDCGNDSAIFRYEWFTKSDTCGFSLNSAVTCNPEISLVPVDYNGAEFNYVEKLVMRGFPQCAFSVDSFKAYLAQNASGDFISLFGSSLMTGASLATGNVVGASLGAVGMAGSINNIMVAANRPPQARGSAGGSVDVAMRTKNFYFKQMHVTYQYAQIIDEFFDVYGYQTNRVKLPNIMTRPHWNYVKTRDVSITGSVPVDDMATIKSVYNNGVTFWRNGSEVGHYELDNSIQ